MLTPSDDTQLQPTTPSSPQAPCSCSSSALVTRVGSYALVATVAWRLPELLLAEGNAGLWATLLILAVGAPTALKDVGAVVAAWRGGSK
jgi:hypothetical protein